MPSDYTINQNYQATFKELAAKNTWGLSQCPPHHKCKFCQKYKETDFVRQYRNLYLAGIPVNLLVPILDRTAKIHGKEVETHAYRQGWHQKRAKIKKLVIDQDFVGLLALQRYTDTQRVISPNSADKSLELLAKVAGVGKEININGQINHSWEQMLTKGKGNPELDVTITLMEDDIVELPEDAPLLEDQGG